MSLTATILSATGDENYPNDHVHGRFEFSVANDSDVSFVSTITVAHACFLIEHTPVAFINPNAYSQMVQAIAEAEEHASLVGREFTSQE